MAMTRIVSCEIYEEKIRKKAKCSLWIIESSFESMAFNVEHGMINIIQNIIM